MDMEDVKDITVLQNYFVIIELKDGKKIKTALFALNQPDAVSRALKIYNDKQKTNPIINSDG